MQQTKARYLPQIDEFACTAHGDCVDIAPDVFELDDVAQVIGDGPPDLILKAAKACPSVAIVVIDAETGEQVFP
jgi:ferredoxin